MYYELSARFIELDTKTSCHDNDNEYYVIS